MNRRTFIETSAAGAASAVVLNSVGCGGKSVSGMIAILSGAVGELKILFPDKTSILNKIVTLATDFNNDWIAGKFDSARTFFENLDTTVQQVIGDLGINSSTRVKLLLASLGIALRVIAALIAEQGQASPVATRAVTPATVNRVKQLANPSDADVILKAVKQ